MMILLPVPARRHWLLAFWLVVSLVSGLSVGILLALFLSPVWLASGVVCSAVAALPGLLRPQLALLPYRAWNKVARYVVRGLRLLLMSICFYTVFAAVRCAGLKGSCLRLTRPTENESLWTPRVTLSTAAYFNPCDKTGTPKEHGWISNFIGWVATSDNRWAFLLLPFLTLLSLLDTDDQTAGFPENIYTLF